MSIVLLQCVNNVEAIFGEKKRQEQKLKEEQALEAAQAQAELEAQQAAESIDIFGYSVTKKTFAFTLLCVWFSVLFLVKSVSFKKSKKEVTTGRGIVVKEKPLKGNRPSAPLDVVIVGCGVPKRGMGWYHLTQLLEMENVNMRAVVEPFFLNPALCPNKPSAFEDFQSTTSKLGVQFVKSIDELGTFGKKTLCLIAGRTMDNPKLFRQCLENGSSFIYLEKPGAPSVAELKDMKSRAEIMGAKVYLGYNKNVTPYVTKALVQQRTVKGSSVSFVHNNDYKESELPECFERNAEGMMKNMAVHELALLVTFFGVTVETIQDFKVDKKFSKKLTLGKFTDFSKVSFQITTKNKNIVSVTADRCGGNVSWASVLNSRGKEVAKFEFPDADAIAKVEAQTKADPEMMPYFFVQSDDYLELKSRVVDACIEEKAANGVATIDVAIEALRLGEYATDKLKNEL